MVDVAENIIFTPHICSLLRLVIFFCSFCLYTDKIAKILIDSLTYYKRVCFKKKKGGQNVDGCGGVVSKKNWQWKLLDKWEKDQGPKLKLRDWKIEKLLSYGKERLEVMATSFVDESAVEEIAVDEMTFSPLTTEAQRTTRK